ncbi:hypothetical protein H1R20_g1239, partial [Candolleomyces eurysporus]
MPELDHPPSIEVPESTRTSSTLVQDGDESGGEDSQDGEEEEPVAPAKCGRGGPRKTQDAPKPAEETQLTFSILMFSLGELAKAKTKCEPENCIMTMSPDAPWIDIQDQVKIHIIDGLFAGTKTPIDSTWYHMFCTIRPAVKDPISLSSKKDYGSLLEFVAPKTKNRNITIIVNELAAWKNKDKGSLEKENHGSQQKTGNDSDGNKSSVPLKKKKKLKSKKIFVKWETIELELSLVAN